MSNDYDEEGWPIIDAPELTGDPDDPICIGCNKKPHEIAEYRDAVTYESSDVRYNPNESQMQERTVRYVKSEEGTYNRHNGHFTCTECYIKMGQPSSSSGWKAP